MTSMPVARTLTKQRAEQEGEAKAWRRPGSPGAAWSCGPSGHQPSAWTRPPALTTSSAQCCL